MCTSDLAVDRMAARVSILLELSAADDLEQFRLVVEQEGFDVVNESGLWYGRSIGSKKMRLEERTPLLIASMFGSKRVLKFILESNRVDVNKASGSDWATALHLAVAGGSSSMIEIIKLLIEANADINCLDVHKNRPIDLVPFVFNSKRKTLELMLNGFCFDNEDLNGLPERVDDQTAWPILIPEKKEYPIDLSLPDMKNGIYSTDEFRMYTFKIKPCSRAYSHDWTECPFVHPGENARRRDPRKYHYSCVPCPEFRKGSCRQGDGCEYAHGIFECWLHPAQYRTRLCKDEVGCNRKVCFFAHKPDELRPLHPSTGSAVLSPLSLSDISPISPFSSPRVGPMWSNSNQSSPIVKNLSCRFKTSQNGWDFDLKAELMRVDRDRDHDRYHQQQMFDKFVGFRGDYSEEYNIPTGLSRKSFDLFSSSDPTILSQLQGLSLESRITEFNNTNSNFSSGLPSFGTNQIMNSRLAAFGKRSQSFVDRGTVNHQTGFASPVSIMVPSKLSDWGSPDGKLNWGIEKDELNKLRKSASFGVHSSKTNYGSPSQTGPTCNVTFDEDQHLQPYMEQEQLVA